MRSLRHKPKTQEELHKLINKYIFEALEEIKLTGDKKKALQRCNDKQKQAIKDFINFTNIK